MSNLALRTIIGAILIAIALIAVVSGGYVFAVLCAAAATAVFYEWTKLVRGWGPAWYVGGFLYALAGALSLLWVRDRSEDGVALVLWVFAIVWTTDIAAYFSGKAFGGAKLAPSISPNKTWAGFHGGIAGATLVAGAWALFMDLGFNALLLAPVFSVAAQLGDLFESWMKRKAGVKDSGALLPGHGGIFDRLDGLLPVAILTALCVVGDVL